MLVLTRKTDQRILIGRKLVLTVVDIKGDKVRIGLEAPKGVVINREEVARRVPALASLHGVPFDNLPAA